MDRQDSRYGNNDYGYDRYRSSSYDRESGYRGSGSSSYDRRDYSSGNSEYERQSNDYRSSSPYDTTNRYNNRQNYGNGGYGRSSTEWYTSRPDYRSSPYDTSNRPNGGQYYNSGGSGRSSPDWYNSRPDDQRHWSSDKPLRRNPYYISSNGHGGNREGTNYDYGSGSFSGRDGSSLNDSNYRSGGGGGRYDTDYSRRGDSYSQSGYSPYRDQSSYSSSSWSSSERSRTGRATVSPEEEENFQYVNRERRQHGLQELLWSDDLSREAQRWSRHLADTGELYHRKPLSQNIDEGWITVTENVAYNPSAGYDGAHSSFMQSPGHRKNILDPKVNRMGIGVTKVWYPGSENYRAGDLYYVVQIFKQV
jgi:uncharacterized protein YkwD